MKMRFTSRRKLSKLRVVFWASAGVGLPLALPASAAFGQLTIIYNYTGSAQTFTVSSTNNYEITAYGAQGGADVFGAAGGRGAFAAGTGTLSASDPIQLYVGGAGTSNPGGQANGGGAAGEAARLYTTPTVVNSLSSPGAAAAPTMASPAAPA
jgi:hypothetical protein